MEVRSFCFLAVLSLCSLLQTEDNLHLCKISMIIDLNIYLFYLTKKDATPRVSVCAVNIAATHPIMAMKVMVLTGSLKEVLTDSPRSSPISCLIKTSRSIYIFKCAYC